MHSIRREVTMKTICMLACLQLFIPDTSRAQFPATIDLGNFDEDVRIQSNIRDLFGSDLAVGDFNGDGYADILAGAYTYSVRENLRFAIGRAYIIFGGPSLSPVVDLRDSGAGVVTITGDDPRDFTGFYVGAGDVNGDGITDAIIGSLQFTHPIARGKLYIVYGRKNWPTEIDLDTNGGPVAGVTRVIGKQRGDTIGQIAASGDVNGDGYSDVLIGAVNAGREHELGKAGLAYSLWPGFTGCHC